MLAAGNFINKTNEGNMKKMVMSLILFILGGLSQALAGDVEIGKAVEKNGMHLAAVYIQPIKMEPEHKTSSSMADIHLEADVKALKNNRNGFTEGSWVPYLNINYKLTKLNSTWKTAGALMPMVANDGPHYGDNVALDGPGKYTLTFSFAPPSGHIFMRHVDKETGVDNWWSPFEIEYNFSWIGSTGKKGGY